MAGTIEFGASPEDNNSELLGERHPQAEQLATLSAADAAFSLNEPYRATRLDTAARPSSWAQWLHALGSETAALAAASLVDFGVAKSFAEAGASALLERHAPGMSPGAGVVAKAALAAPALALSLLASQVIIRPALLSIFGAHLAEADPREVFRDSTDRTDRDAVERNRSLLRELQAATRIGHVLPNVITFTAFGIAYGLRSVMEGASGTALTSTFASTGGGALMGAGLSTLQILAKTRDGQAAFQVSSQDIRTAVSNAFQSITVVELENGTRTDSRAWQVRNLVQHLGVLSLASLFGIMTANAYGAWMQTREAPSSDADAFLRSYGGVFATVGVFFFATLRLTARRGSTDDRLMSGTRGALQEIARFEHPGSLEKLFRLDPNGSTANTVGGFERIYHNAAVIMSLPAHAALDLANLATRAWHPPLPQPAPQP
jgi:hypothetical protein